MQRISILLEHEVVEGPVVRNNTISVRVCILQFCIHLKPLRRTPFDTLLDTCLCAKTFPGIGDLGFGTQTASLTEPLSRHATGITFPDVLSDVDQLQSCESSSVCKQVLDKL